MTQPLTPPTFSGGGYTTPLTDIGSGYAAGISSAGQSIAGAIGAVMGGYNAKTGEVQPGILDQKKSSEDTLEMLHTHGVLDDATYEKAMTSGLGAQQKMIGQSTSEFNTKLQAQLEYNKAMDVARLTEGGAMQRTQASEAGALQRQQIASAAKEAPKPAEPLVRRAPTPVPPSPIFNQVPQPTMKLGLP